MEPDHRGLDAVEALARGDVEGRAVVAEADVGGGLAGVQRAEVGPVGGEDQDPAGAGGEEVAVLVDLQAVGQPLERLDPPGGVEEDPAGPGRASRARRTIAASPGVWTSLYDSSSRKYVILPGATVAVYLWKPDDREASLPPTKS